jgi:hypothetical protein
MNEWAPGFSNSDLERAQERYQLRFPPDLRELLLDRSPVGGYDWSTDDPKIRKMLDWPLDALIWDVDNGTWWLDWGDRPESSQERLEIVRSVVARAPRLIPVYSHRFIPETPSVSGNPIFSMHGFDTIYYGGNLSEYFANEFGGVHLLNGKNPADHTLEDTLALRQIPFWSNLALYQARKLVICEE